MKPRIVEPEILDGLSPDDLRAQRSRADLRRVNALMGNAQVVARLLATRRLRRILEIGAGDGTFMLRVARRVESGRNESSALHPPLVTLLDLHPHPAPEGFAALGWNVETVAADVFDHLRGEERYDAVVANLFLHHFEDDRLAELLRLVSERTRLFVACEPRRSALSLATCRTLRLIGCNDVTRHDARVSVRAGFAGRELSNLWPAAGWTLTERAAPPFSHAFRAVRG